MLLCYLHIRILKKKIKKVDVLLLKLNILREEEKQGSKVQIIPYLFNICILFFSIFFFFLFHVLYLLIFIVLCWSLLILNDFGNICVLATFVYWWHSCFGNICVLEIFAFWWHFRFSKDSPPSLYSLPTPYSPPNSKKSTCNP